MKIITKKEIEKLSAPLRQGKGYVKSQKMYEQLRNLKLGESLFMSREEWEATPYKSKSFRTWYASGNYAKKKAKNGSLSKLDFEVTTYQEGWVIERIK